MTTHTTGSKSREDKSVGADRSACDRAETETVNHRTAQLPLFFQAENDLFDAETGELVDNNSGIQSANDDAESVRDLISSADPSAPQLIPLAPKELLTATELKRASLKIGQALARSSDEEQASRGRTMLICSEKLRSDRGHLRSMRRCKNRWCMNCNLARQAKTVSRVTRAMNQYMSTRLAGDAHHLTHRNKQTVVLKFTLNAGEACRLSQVGHRIKMMNRALRNMTRARGLRDEVVGWFRSAEITQSDSDHAHPHLHGALLLRLDSNIEQVKRAIRGYWPGRIADLLKDDATGLKPITVASVQSLDCLEADTIEHLTAWVRYCTKGSYDLIGLSRHTRESRLAFEMTSDAYWQALDEQLNKAQMIGFGGDLRDAVRRAEEDYKAERKRERELSGAPQRGRPPEMTRQDDWLYMHSIEGYAPLREILSARSITELIASPNVTSGRLDPSSFEVEKMTVRADNPTATSALVWLALNARVHGLSMRPHQSMSPKQYKATGHHRQHWSEPDERPLDPDWLPIKRGARDED